MQTFDVIVVGAGHAGIEAACACEKLGLRTLVVTMSREAIGRMSCNPAIGGVGKGQLVRELDALGGVMAAAADACMLQFRTLNASKGEAVRSSRAQIDMYAYNVLMRDMLCSRAGITVREGHVRKLLVRGRAAAGVVLSGGEEIESKAVVIAPGTFLEGRIHVGLRNHTGGRIGEAASEGLAADLAGHGFRCMRFKTGTCPRLDAKTIDYADLIVQEGDAIVHPFSSRKGAPVSGAGLPRLPCHITYTTPAAHDVIRRNLDRSPLYAGVIKAAGVRYCPSIEDKVVRFSGRDRHQVFLEPEGAGSDRVYPNGLSTSLPEDVQEELIHSIPGLERARILTYGYGIEHTVVDATQLYPTLESKLIGSLYLAGQIVGTTGYEEAAAQGLVAGINAALRAVGKEPLVLDRASSYIGVLIDDLTGKGTAEPYRMFTSRVEYRLLIREDNADTRLGAIAQAIGMITDEEYALVQEKAAGISRGLAYLRNNRVPVRQELNDALREMRSAPVRRAVTLEELLKRPELTLGSLRRLGLVNGEVPGELERRVEIEVKYRGFIERQAKDVERFRHLEKIIIPDGIDYAAIPGISREIQEKLTLQRPYTLGQASRISGVTPAAVSLLMVYIRKLCAG